MSASKRTLNDLEIGSRARITELDTTNEITQRLMIMGVLPDSEVKLVQIAPLGDPIAIEIAGRRLSLRRREAASIQIQNA